MLVGTKLANLSKIIPTNPQSEHNPTLTSTVVGLGKRMTLHTTPPNIMETQQQQQQ